MSEEQRPDTVFVVDNEPINLALLSANLEKRYNVLSYSRGAAALEAGRREPPDLMLLDVVMPEMNGYEVLRAWKQCEETKDVPVIFVTGRGAVEEQTRGLIAGAVDYITKPFQMPLVLARAETHLKLKRKSDLLDRLASIDALTEIGNRRRFEDVIDREWRRAARQQHWLSLAMLDVDVFKLFNDKYGHAAGDECLRRVAGALETTVRRGEDFVARYGGEEFAIVLPGTDLDGAQQLGEILRAAVESLAIPHIDNADRGRVTASVGVASLIPTPKGSPVRLVEAADRELYRAKELGRNRVCPLRDRARSVLSLQTGVGESSGLRF